MLSSNDTTLFSQVAAQFRKRPSWCRPHPSTSAPPAPPLPTALDGVGGIEGGGSVQRRPRTPPAPHVDAHAVGEAEGAHPPPPPPPRTTPAAASTAASTRPFDSRHGCVRKVLEKGADHRGVGDRRRRGGGGGQGGVGVQ